MALKGPAFDSKLCTFNALIYRSSSSAAIPDLALVVWSLIEEIGLLRRGPKVGSVVVSLISGRLGCKRPSAPRNSVHGAWVGSGGASATSVLDGF